MAGYQGVAGKFIAVEPRVRFWSKVDLGEGCWLWTGALFASGYGCFFYDGRVQPAHRWAYEQVNGPVPNGKEIDHLCRTRNCVRADHLEAVSHRTNCQRGDVGLNQTSKTHCRQGHPYTGHNLVVRKNGNRLCRTCQYAVLVRWRQRNKERYNMKQREYGARFRARRRSG